MPAGKRHVDKNSEFKKKYLPCNMRRYVIHSPAQSSAPGRSASWLRQRCATRCPFSPGHQPTPGNRPERQLLAARLPPVCQPMRGQRFDAQKNPPIGRRLTERWRDCDDRLIAQGFHPRQHSWHTAWNVNKNNMFKYVKTRGDDVSTF